MKEQSSCIVCNNETALLAECPRCAGAGHTFSDDGDCDICAGMGKAYSTASGWYLPESGYREDSWHMGSWVLY